MNNPAFPPSSAHDDVERSFASELTRNATVELTSAQVTDLEQARDLLPLGTKIFLPDNVESTVEKLDAIAAIKEYGFDPVPHLALSRGLSEPNLRDFLTTAAGDYGVHRVHLLGSPADPGDTTRFLEAEILVDTGVRAVTLRGYPEGNPGSDPSDNEQELAASMELAAAQGMGIDIVTQYSYAPSRTLEFCARLERVAPEINQYIAIAGASTEKELQTYAQAHHISTSLRGLERFGAKAVSEHCHPSADEQLHYFARHCATLGPGNIIGLHLLCPGGFHNAATWLNQNLS